MVARAFRVLEPLPHCTVHRAMTGPLPPRFPPSAPSLPPRLKALAWQLAEVLRLAQREAAANP